MKLPTPLEQQLLDVTRSLLAVADLRWGCGLATRTDIYLFRKRRALGVAHPARPGERLRIGLNLHVAEQNPSLILNNTAPHEVAHLVELALHGRMSRSRTWQRYCRELGGTGDRTTRCDDVTVIKGRRTRHYLYRLPSGREVWTTKGRHAKYQRGWVARLRDTGERLAREHFTGESALR